MLARDALSRLAADVPKTRLHPLTQLARVPPRTLLARNIPKALRVRTLSCAYLSTLNACRSYATTARATKPTATVKKAVKAKATAKTPAKRATKAKARKAAPAKKTAKRTAKKPAKKTAARKKAAPKKPTARRTRRKVLSPEEKEKAVIRELRQKALKEPVSYKATSSYNALVGEMSTGPNKATGKATQIVADAMKKYKTLTAAEHEHYNHLANESTAAKRAEYQAWIRTYTPDQIRIANNARALLRKKLGRSAVSGAYPAHTTKLHDDRHVKQASSPYLLFFKERWASGDFKGIKTPDAAKLASSEWKALTAGEKKKYEDLSQAEQARVTREKAAQAS